MEIKLPIVEQKNIHSIAYLTFLESNKLPLQAKFIFLHLDARAGSNRYIWFKKEKIYETIGMSKNTYDKYLNMLEEQHAIIQFVRTSNENGSRETNVIVVCEYDQINDCFREPSNIKEIVETITIKFKNYTIVKSNSKSIDTPLSKIDHGGSKIDRGVKSEKSSNDPMSKFDLSHVKICTPPCQNLTPNHRKINNRKINNRKIDQSINQSESINQNYDKGIDGLIDNKTGNKSNYELFIKDLKAKYNLSDEELKVCLLRLKGKKITNPIRFFETVVKNYCKNERGILKDVLDAEKSMPLRPKQTKPSSSSNERKYNPDALEKLLLGRYTDDEEFNNLSNNLCI